MNDLHDCTVVTVTHNSRRLLDHGQWRQYPRLIIVDNDSSDGTADWVLSSLPHAQLIRNNVNVGYGRANNIALSKVQTSYALLLNPDCQFSSSSLQAMLECAHRNPNAALIGPRYVNHLGKTIEACRPFFHRRRLSHARYVDPSGDVCTEFITGAALLVSVNCVRELGGFDPWYFLYCEDEDLAWRARAAGKAVLVAAGALAMHSPMRSSLPSLRLVFVRHYCHTLSKLYLRRRVGYSAQMLTLYGSSVLLGSLLLLPLRLLCLSWSRSLRECARIAAVLSAPAQLSAPNCRPPI